MAASAAPWAHVQAQADPPAGQLFWVGGHGSNWSTAANWSPSRAPVNGDVLNFSPSPTPATFNDIVGLQLGDILIQGPGVTLSGNPLTTGGVTALGPGDTVALDLAVPSGELHLGGYLTVSSSISGAGNVHVYAGVPANGAGGPNVRFTGTAANTYAGVTRIEPGAILTLAKAPGVVAVPSGTLTVEPNSGDLQSRGKVMVATPGQIGDGVSVDVPDSPQYSGGLIFDASAVPSPVPVPFERTGPISIGAAGYLIVGGRGRQPVLATPSLRLATGSTLGVTVADGSSGSISIDGSCALDGAALYLSTSGSAPPLGQPLRLLDNQGSAAVRGIFAGLPEGWALATGTSRATPELTSVAYRISYRGGDGNDVTVTPIDGREYAIRQAYQLLLDRAADRGGAAYWSAFLTSGGDGAAFSRALTYSAEGRERVVRAGFADLLNRPADPGGLAYWTNAITHGLRVDRFRAALAGSAEFASHPGAVSTSGFLTNLYPLPSVIGRSADPDGLAYWSAQIDGGRLTRSQVALGLLQSDESMLVNIGRPNDAFVALSATVYRFLGGDYYGTLAEALATRPLR